MAIEITKLKVNYKTLEEFKKFKEYGIQELSMSEDLEANIIEDDSESPFYGIYFTDKLIARMSMYQVNGKFNRYFEPPLKLFRNLEVRGTTRLSRKRFWLFTCQFSQKEKRNANQTESSCKIKKLLGKNGLSLSQLRYGARLR